MELIDQLNAELARKFKKRAPILMRGADLPPVEWISTGLLGYDWVNGGGGPRGKCEQIYGRRSSGKTTLALRRIAEAQRAGLRCLYIDVEHDLDKAWAKKIGVDLENLLLHEPEFEPAEITLGMIEALLKLEEVDLIVVDSISALGTEAMLSEDKTIGDKHYAGIAGLLEMFYKRVVGTGLLYNSNAILIWINQPRELIGARIPLERLPGGRALQHMSSIITETKQGDYITVGSKTEEEKIGIEIKIINRKNKVRWPYREQTLRLHFASGFNPLWEVIHFGTKYGLIELRGAWGYYKEHELGQGVNAHMSYLIDNTDVYKEIKTEVIELIKRGK